MTEKLSFPRQHARTQRFTLGSPRAFSVAPDGGRVVFLRSRGGTRRENLLWVRDTGSGAERIAADPTALLAGAAEQLSAEERARRERSREGSGGVVAYALDAAAELAAFSLSGRLFVAELGDTAAAASAASARELPVGDAGTPAGSSVVDPRPSPDGRHIAYALGGALRVVAADGSGDRALAEPTEAERAAGSVGYGQAEFIAAEEMDRSRGFWWSPEGDRLLVARVDDAPVRRWWIADPANPDRSPAEVAYPAAGTANAEVSLLVAGLDGSLVEVGWDYEAYPYLARVHWSSGGPPLLLVQARDQRGQQYLTVDPDSGRTEVLHTETDPVWLDLLPGVPAWAPGGRLVRISDEGGARRLVVGDRPLTGPRLHVRAVLDVAEDSVLISASAGPEAEDAEIGEIHVYRVTEDGVARVSSGAGVHSAARSGPLTVLVSTSLERGGAEARLVGEDGGILGTVSSHAEKPVLTARAQLLEGGARRIPCALLLPSDYREGDGPLPVLMDPYGGPHGQRVLAAHNAHLTSQWFADQGFAVITADGRGTPGRSPDWEKAIVGDFAGATLDDQVEALHALARNHPLDLGRVGIRGWSYGGYLAALAVLRRPDVFHAGVAGAPVTDWRLYDTHYTERYLGLPAENPETYAANSLVTDEGLSRAAEPSRPLMVVHGLADDNVVAAHTLRLSSALLAEGRPHEVLPLSGVTHMTPQEQVAENLLLLQVAFLKRSLGVD
ncbi:S9 family peptidase [Streptomyces sp. TP-A0874]|uniref:S9 family peptidase n=1 Tax=Streptomyces sp. TP-A0874 TaxID=549819 RepID=UPI0008532FD2|nr:prolyl oligopeptidase family serine peptidase [Streptomyces sp. TP-A0874]